MSTVRIQVRRGLSTEWTSVNPVLAGGEVGLETDSLQIKIGDGTAHWNDLGYATVTPANLTDAINAAITGTIDTSFATIVDLNNAIAQEVTDRNTAVAAEAATRVSAINSTRSFVTSSVLNETNRALTVESGLQNSITNAVTHTDEKFQTEQSRAENAETDLGNRISSETSNRISGDAATLASAESYVDGKIENLVNGSPALLDTLSQLAAALGEDPNFATTITNQISGIQTNGTLTNTTLNSPSLDNATFTSDAHFNGNIVSNPQTIYGRQLVDGSISTAQLGTNSVTKVNIVDGAVDASKISNHSITSAQIAPATIEGDRIVPSAITYGLIADKTIKARNIEDNTITANQIAEDAITSNELAVDAVITENIADDAVTTVKIHSVAMEKVTGLNAELLTLAPLDAPTFTGVVSLPATTSIGNVSATELGYVDGVTSSIQTQFGTAATNLSTHSSTTTNVHGISDTAALATKTYADNKKSEAITTAESYTDSAITTEVTNRNTAIAVETSARQTAVTNAITTAEGYTDTAISTEVTNRNTAIATAKSQAISTSESYTDTAISNLVNGAPSTLDTLKELADALGSDANLATTVTNHIATAKSEAEAYTDSSIAAEVTNRNTAIATAKSQAISTSESYTDTAISTEVTNRNAAIATSLTTAEGYTDTAKAAAISTSESYTDSAISTEVTNRNSAIATAKSQAITTSEGYTDSAISTEVTNRNSAISTQAATTLTTAESYTDTAKAAAISTSEAYTDIAKAAAISTSEGYTDTHAALTAAHGATGAVVGTTNTQTLTNKTLTSPVINTPTGITKSDVGLANVNNTSDANKPVSTATQTALDAKLSLAGGTMTGNLILNADPTNSLGAVTKQYVDAAITNVNIHESVVAATTGNVNLTNAVDNNKVLDGVTIKTGDRILVKNQTTASANGIYIVASNGAPTRATDYDAVGEISSGDFIFVEGGTVNANTGWVQTYHVVTLGTDPINFTQFSGAGTYTSGTGITLTGTTFAIDSTVATLTGTQTLTNKTLTSPTITGTGAIAGTFTGNLTGNVTGNVSGNAGTVTNGVYTTDTGTVTSTMIADGTIVDSDINASAAIAKTKVAGTAITQADTATVTNTMLAGSIANAKLSNSSVTVGTTAIALGASATTLGGLTSVTSTGFTGALTGNADTATKLATSRNINGVAFDGSAAITVKASTTNALTIGTGLSGTSFDGSGAVTIAIDSSVVTLNGLQSLANKTLKGPIYLQSGGGAGGSNNYIDVNNSTGAVSLVSGYPLNLTASGNITLTATGGVAQVGSDTIATLTASQTLTNKTLTSPVIGTIVNTGTLTLPTSTDTLIGKATTDTLTNKTFDTAGTGNVFKVNGVQISSNTGTGANVLATSPSVTGLATDTLTTTGNVTVGGNLTVNGTTTTINSTTLNTTEQVLVISNAATPTDVTANGAGITIKGATDKTLKWYSATGALTSSENVDLASGKTYKINGTTVLSATAVGGQTIPASAIVGLTDTQTLTNKTLTSPAITLPSAGITFSDGTVQKVAGVPSLTTIGTTISASTTLGAGLTDQMIPVAGTVNITIPANATVAYPIGTSIDFYQSSGSAAAFVAASGVTFINTPGLKMRATGSVATAMKVAIDTWLIFGDLAA